ncbi:formylglycine-generating enzyme family protein [Candidatus Thiodictyon syntrophicum]|jgi:formylglycine-generating enzyme required for sulfatase activity|nr:formylglycine-generating enzyme family protein [Candidatus Thiodictyon syntrophicum]
MISLPVALYLALTLAWLLHPAPAAAWTEEELKAAERLLERELDQRWTAEADARDRTAADAKARAQTASEAAARAAVARRQMIETLAQTLVEIPGGSFEMGCGPGDDACEGDERPAHRVSVKPVRIGRHEVTQAQWTAVMGANPAQIQDDQRPVEMVSWDQVQQFLKRLNVETEGPPYRLPTEAEWEYAARAGTRTAWWWGAEIGRGNANCDGCAGPAADRETARVGTLTPNAFGLYDTAGNVAEWVQDCYHETYSAAPTDGSAWPGPCPDGYRVVRGGSWLGRPASVRSADRQSVWPSDRSGDRGFRLARDL